MEAPIAESPREDPPETSAPEEAPAAAKAVATVEPKEDVS